MSDVLIKGGELGPTILIDKAFSDSRPYQTYLEAYRNVEQALDRDRRGARRYWAALEAGERPEARFVVDVHQVQETGVLKMLLWNTAPPMSEAEMRRYFTSVGTSHEAAEQYSSVRRDGQFGQGFRQGTLPWNTYGVVAIAVDPQLPAEERALMMWMHKAPLHPGGPLVYSVRSLPAYVDATGGVVEDIVIPVCTVDGMDFAAMIPEEVTAQGGMVFVMLGNDVCEDTHHGSRLKRETGAGICAFLNNATLDGAMCTVTFATTDSAAGGGRRFEVDGRALRFDRRRMKSYADWELGRVGADGEPVGVQHGELRNPQTGVRYRWMAGPLDMKPSRHDVWNGKGFVVAPYKTDVHLVMRSATVADRAFAFGMLAKTASVVGLQVFLPLRTTDEQDGLHVEQRLDRSELVLASGVDIPWREIGAWFAEHLPAPIAALNAQVEALSEKKVYDLARFKRRTRAYLQGLKRSESNVEDRDGDEPGDPLGRDAGQRGGGGTGPPERSRPGVRRRELDRNPDGGRFGKLRVKADLPDVRWLSRAEWDEQVGESGNHLAVYRRGARAVLFGNAAHHLVQHVANVVADELRDETGLLPDVTYPRDHLTGQIQQHLTCDLLGTISHIERVCADDPEARDRLLAPEILTAAAAGFDSLVELLKREVTAGARRLRTAG